MRYQQLRPMRRLTIMTPERQRHFTFWNVGWSSPRKVDTGLSFFRPFVLWSSPRKVDTGLSFFRPFVLRRGHVPQRRVPALGVVEDLDVLHDRRPRLRPRGEVRAVDQ